MKSDRRAIYLCSWQQRQVDLCPWLDLADTCWRVYNAFADNVICVLKFVLILILMFVLKDDLNASLEGHTVMIQEYVMNGRFCRVTYCIDCSRCIGNRMNLTIWYLPYSINAISRDRHRSPFATVAATHRLIGPRQ